MKTCNTCAVAKPLRDYYVQASGPDGRMGRCKECHRRAARERHYRKMRDPEWVAAERARSRAKSVKKSYNRSAVTRSAHSASIRCVPDIPAGFERHHWSYQHSQWKDVMVLLRGHHRAIHHYMTYDEAAEVFRTPRGHLLDTREKHERWIAAVLRERGRFMEEVA